MIILTFISGFFEFNWYSHSRGVDISAVLFMFTYLTVGVLVHYCVLYGIKIQNGYYLLPFIVIYSIMCTVESIFILSVIFKMLEIQPDGPHQSLGFFVVGTFISVGVQLLMLFAILRCRQFLSLKLQHEMELKVAEKSKAQNPAIRIVMADATDANTTMSPNGVDPPV